MGDYRRHQKFDERTPVDVWLGFYPFGFAEDDAREYASGRRISDADRLACERERHGEPDGYNDGISMWCRVCTALPDEVLACGLRPSKGDVPVRVTFRTPTRIDSSGTFHVGLFVVSNPDAEEIDDLTLESPNSFHAPLGLYWDDSPQPTPIRGLKRCFRLTDDGWQECGPCNRNSVRRSSAFRPSECADFDTAFDAAARGGASAALSAVRSAYVGQRSGSAGAKRGAWHRALQTARGEGYLITDDLISKGVMRYA